MYKPSMELINSRYYIRCMEETIRSGEYNSKYLKDMRKKIINEINKAISLAKENKFK